MTAAIANHSDSCLGPGHGRDYKVGTSVPANTPHAVSVSLPLWSDNVDYEEGRLAEVMEIGYPRFFIHKMIKELSNQLKSRFGQPSEDCILLPSSKVAQRCRHFILDQHSKSQSSSSSSPPSIRIVHFDILPESSNSDLDIHIVLFPMELFPLAKSYWQHTGDGISSRFAEKCLNLLKSSGHLPSSLSDSNKIQANVNIPASPVGSNGSTSPTNSTFLASSALDGISSVEGGIGAMTSSSSSSSSAALNQRSSRSYGRNKHYSRAASSNSISGLSTPTSNSTSNIQIENLSIANSSSSSSTSNLNGTKEASQSNPQTEELTSDATTYLEERYGRNLPLTSAPVAKRALRRRIAGKLGDSDSAADSIKDLGEDHVNEDIGVLKEIADRRDLDDDQSRVNESDVWLMPTGMSAIFHAHQVAMEWRRKESGNPSEELGKSVCFGFPYTDTLKILQKWGPGCHFYGHGNSSDIESFTSLLESQDSSSPTRIQALFCEFPSNPLLRSPPLAKLRELADKYNFLIVVDETIGNYLNVNVLPFADIVVSSLTKVFSGEANGMAGAMILNPRSKHIDDLRKIMEIEWEDNLKDEDAIFLERNSRDAKERVLKIDENAEMLADLLYQSKSEFKKSGEDRNRVIKEVFYPKYVTTDLYNVCRRRTNENNSDSNPNYTAGFGGLLTVTFNNIKASQIFYDTLKCAKGPSLGTNFTLASPYAILAHYAELDWVEEFGVERGLVRISVGLENREELKEMIEKALEAAEEGTRG